MDISVLQIGLDILISVAFGALGAVAAWFKLKGNQDLITLELKNVKKNQEHDAERFDTELKKLIESKSELNRQTHKRIDTLKVVVENNREKGDKTAQEIVKNMNAMELRIIQAIHEIK